MHHVVEVLGIVLDEAEGDAWDVPDAMQQVGAEVEVCGTVGHSVTECAHCFEGFAGGEGEGADDGLLGCIGATPMTCPACDEEEVSQKSPTLTAGRF